MESPSGSAVPFWRPAYQHRERQQGVELGNLPSGHRLFDNRLSCSAVFGSVRQCSAKCGHHSAGGLLFSLVFIDIYIEPIW